MLLLLITKTVQRKCRKKLEEFTLSSMIGQKIFGIDSWFCSSRTILLEGERKNKGSPV